VVRELEVEVCGVKSSGRPRHAKGCTSKEDEEDKFFTQLILRGLCTIIRSCSYAVTKVLA
jgi:hypothetical protein